ncbi:MAG: NAD(+)/NADH kinase [Planctomycetaceae bacterium]|jgi:NAD+ kinase|nr:NAD(+)/NADH kinase [Planctomycetaceae bacterium]
MMRVILLGNGTKQGVYEAVSEIRSEIERRVTVIAEDWSGREDFSGLAADMVIVFGGDGSILRAVNQMGANPAPLLTVHLGTLSFLSTIRIDDLVPLLDSSGLLRLPVIHHLLLECQLFRGGGDFPSQPAETRLALNEVVIHGDTPSRLISVEMYIDGDLVTTYRSDGLILCTPVGSTARNLSTGGPILRKDIDAVVISPICPHTLSNRPLVDSPDRQFEFRVHQNAVLILDGMEPARINPCDMVRVCRAVQTFNTLDIPGFCYYKALRTKLGWNGSFTE